MLSKRKDLTGQTFGYLTVIERAEDYVAPKHEKRHSRWLCQCSYDNCTNSFVAYQSRLLNGNTISCPECARKISALNSRIGNEYEFTVDTCIGYTSKGEVFAVDIEDYDKIKDYTWYYDSEGYVRGECPVDGGRKSILLSRLIMGFPDDMDVDHKHGTSTLCDNRKSNLRICPHKLNCFNKKQRSDSKTKYKGVHKKKNGKYRANITAFGVRHWLGTFDTEEEARDAYNKAALELHGEYASLS